MTHAVRIISVGAAVQDVFLSGKVFTPEREDGVWVEELPLGAKLELENIVFSTGGGATNAAVTFARQGFKSAFMGKLGRDPAGRAVLDELRDEDVDTQLVSYSTKYATGYSTVLLAPNGERTILAYRGASAHMRPQDFALDKLNADWLYISSLGGDIDLLESIVNHANARHIFVAANPGADELKHKERLRALLPRLTVLSLNKDEMAQLVEGKTIEELARSAAERVPVAVVTDGPNGAAAADSLHVCSAGMYEDVPVLDRTGAGDAFASGFVAAIAQGKSLEYALTLASANSTAVVQQMGAKAGILSHSVKLHDMPIKTEPYA